MVLTKGLQTQLGVLRLHVPPDGDGRETRRGDGRLRDIHGT